ncbi:glycosyltransferase [Mucisphaera calidilacus]|uniref:Alpha-D-kanosaminyltransferase n=1 Tax=Mucisphaera calidilacus TaxID=2527982 RepID=A0A518BUP5_9BACT|nr:glycosyltransferase [Mucisphaera calidilacus]QDU70708.1 Alpha-D-kanosaminyltransferase [Mucisphaera calidilacus]
MRIAYLVNQYPKLSHTFIRREIAALEQLGHTVDRYSVRQTSDHVDPEDRREAANTRIILRGTGPLVAATTWCKLTRPARWIKACFATLRLARHSERGLMRHLIYLMEAARLVADLDRQPVDHLHAHFGTNSATVAYLTSILGGPPYSFTTHGPEEFDKVPAIGLPEKLEHAAAAIAITSFCRSQLMRWMPVDRWDRIHEVHCGLDEHFLGSEPTPVPDTPRLVCVGRICEQKGQLLLIEAVARVRDEGQPVQLVLAGDGDMRPLAEQTINQLNLHDHVSITGWIDATRVRDEILASRALVLPSFAEGLPVVIMEAMALARPVLSTYIAGIPELVREPDNGLLVPAGDIDQLTDAIKRILTLNTQTLTDMGKQGRNAVLERHNANTEAARLAKVFQQVSSKP